MGEVDGDYRSMTDEERRALLEQWDQENRASMTPFQRYLFDNGLFDDVIRPEFSESDVILEPADHCSDVGCGDCIGYWKRDGKVSFCTCDHHKNDEDRNVPYNHCEYLGCGNCLGVVTENTIVSHCTCEHHRDGGTDPLTSGPHDMQKAIFSGPRR